MTTENIETEINNGDKVDFGAYGEKYVVNTEYREDHFLVISTKQPGAEKFRYSKTPPGATSIRKNLAQRIIN